MRKGFTRFCSGFLAMALVFSSSWHTVDAKGRNSTTSAVMIQEEDEKNDAANWNVASGPAVWIQNPDEWMEKYSEKAVNGTAFIKASLDVVIISGAEVNSKQEFLVDLKGENGYHSSQTVVLFESKPDSVKPSDITTKFSELEKGSYTLTVSGDGYVDYTQRIEVKDLNYCISLYTGRTTLFDNPSVHPGLLIRGDVTMDGKLDSNDVSAMIDSMENSYQVKEEQAEKNQTKEKSVKRYDLNGDGKVDLLDLNYLTEFLELKESEKPISTVEKLVPSEAVTPDLWNHVDVSEGSLDKMIQGKGGVTLIAPSDDKISKEHPIELSFDFTRSEEQVELEGMLFTTPKGEEGAVEEGEIGIIYQEDGKLKSETIVFSATNTMQRSRSDSGFRTEELLTEKEQKTKKLEILSGDENVLSAYWKRDGELQISLNGQIAVKLITFRITKTSGSKNLAKISSVEFINDMESKIPEPVINIPKGLAVVSGSRSFTLDWNEEKNVTGYEVCISSNGLTEYKRTTLHSMTIRQFQGEELSRKREYIVSVQSVNGEWKSGFSDSVPVILKVDQVPDAPDRVTATGGYRVMEVRWSELKEADTYNLFYREEGMTEFTKISGIKGLSYQISGLKDGTKYEVYLTATNELGEGAASLMAADKTLSSLTEVLLPEYKLINTSNGRGTLSEHIKSATIGGIGVMVDSPLDQTEHSALGLFDNRFDSYVKCEDWDYGGAYPGEKKGITVELDKVYKIGMITLAEPSDIGTYYYASVYYWEKDGTRKQAENVSIIRKSSGDRFYYLIQFKGPIETSKIQFGIGRYGGKPRLITVSEVRLYEYDSIKQDIMDLYQDSLHLVLRDDVVEDTIQKLQDRLDTKDPVSQEYHPQREELQKELDAAKQLLKTGGLGNVIQVNPIISAENDKEIAVGGLNAWQPLGVTAAAGEEIVVYVGKQGMSEGAFANLMLVATQQHAESGGFFKTLNLKVGRNEITIPQISSTDKEKGGALYIQYTGKNRNDAYAVRVSGGTSFPVLNIYGVTKEECDKRITNYVQELKEYTSKLKQTHEELHKNSQNDSLDYSYDEKNCILNMTDILTDKMMLSLPASQVLAGLGQDRQEEKLTNSTQAMNDMMTLFYQHKGLSEAFSEGTEDSIIAKNHMPYCYLNIRYMKMFSGAFMYASGNHIGVEWNETKGMLNGVPISSDENGKYNSGQYFGWGIAHEIGHEINQSDYAFAEVTNNYFAILAQAKDRNDSVRFSYPEVWKKVTSDEKGYSDNVFTQLGLYWQLHLAYDRDYNYKTYSTYQEITENLFFARVDSYARDVSKAPAPGNVSLTLCKDRDQNLMRLASAAAERNLSEFFLRWGLTPDATTMNYMEQFALEKRAIYYVDDEARVYEIENGTNGAITGKPVVKASVSVDGSEVTLTMNFTVDNDVLQGYEITRIWTEQGEERKERIGFTKENFFVDSAACASNRVLSYEITAIDKYLNRSAVYRTKAVKIEGDGLLDKKNWTISTNLISDDDETIKANEEMPCETYTVSAAQRMIDNKKNTTFIGRADEEDPYLILELNQIRGVEAICYTLSGEGQPIKDYKIEISEDGENYIEVKTGRFTLKNGKEIVYFENGSDPWICTYDAAYIRLTAVGQQGTELSVSELDLYGPSGDNVEFLSVQGGQTGIGVLKNDYAYGQSANQKIPAGSIVFTGSYKGNPAYNVIALYDEQKNIVGEEVNGEFVAHQIILAPDPGNAMLGETSEGRWIYWIEPDSDISAKDLPSKVRAELYRVDHALTNEGQRLVSDTLFITLPDNLPFLSFDD